MKILVVGAKSAVGKMLVAQTEEENEIVKSSRSKSDFNIDLSDINNAPSLPKDIDTVVHLAASYGGEKSDQILDAENVNVIGSGRLLQKAINANVKHYIFISTIYTQLPSSSPYWSSYALSKKHAEDLLKLICKDSEINLTILRPSQLYGKTDDFRSRQPFLYHIIDQVRGSKPVVFYGNSAPKRNFLHAEDLVKVIQLVIERKLKGTFQVTNPKDYSFEEIANSAIEVFESSSIVKFDSSKPQVQDNIFKFDDSIYKLIDFSPTISLKEGLQRIALNHLS